MSAGVTNGTPTGAGEPLQPAPGQPTRPVWVAPGAAEAPLRKAARRFKACHGALAPRECESFLVTLNRGGYLRRVH